MKALQFPSREARRLVFALAVGLAMALSIGCSRQPAEDVLTRAQTLVAQGDPDSIRAAIDVLTPLVKRKNTPTSVVNYYVALNIRANRADQVLTLAERNAAAAPTDYMAQYLLAKIYHQQNRMDEALKAAKAAWNIQPESLNALTLAARLAGSENDPEANDLFLALAERDDSQVDRTQLYNEWGLWLAQQGQNSRAVAMFWRGCAQADPHHVLYLNMAIVSERTNPRIASNYYRQAKLHLPREGYLDTHRQIQARLRELSL